MRKDMAKVLCEEPRSGGHGAGKGKRRRISKEMNSVDGELCRKRESTGSHRLYGWNAKEFGEHLEPLHKYILSCIGRKWNDVYSEICRTIPKGTVVNNHIYTHMWSYVATQVYIKDGKVYDATYSSYRSKKGLTIYQDTYVHPDTGILMKTPQERRHYRYLPERPKKGTFYSISPLHCYCRDSQTGIWYECFLRVVKQTKVAGFIFTRRDGRQTSPMFWHEVPVYDYYDVFLHHCVTKHGDTKKHYNVSNVYCYAKRQLNKSEIKKVLKLMGVA